MSSIIPFAAGAVLPAYLQNRKALAEINRDITSGIGFPVLSIKGKVFTLVKGNEKKILTRPDDPDEVLQNITLAVVRANKNSRVFYAKAYVEGDSDGAKPTCYSGDSQTPAADAAEPQAKKCQICPHAVWGTGPNGVGTACSVNTRLAVVDPENVGEPWLLRVPAGSRANFADACKIADSRGLPYNAVVLKVGFDKEAPSPKLTFKPIGLAGDDAYAKITELYDSDNVKDIVGLAVRPALEAPVDAPEVDASELDAAIATKAAVTKAAAPAPKATPKPAVKAKVEVEVEPEAAPAPAPVKAKAEPKAPVAAKTEVDDLLGDLDSLLSSTDD